MINNEQIQRINRLLEKQIVRKYGVMALAFLVLGSVAFFGVHRNQAGSAASLGVLSMSPSTGTVTNGTNVTVTLYEDSGTDPVNSVQAAVSYDAAQLQYVSLTEGTAFPNVAATSTGTASVIRVGRGTSPGTSVTGKNTVVKITFKVIGTTGTTSLTYDSAFSFIVRSTDNVNILTSTAGASLVVQLPAPSISSVTPATGPTAGSTVINISGTNIYSGASVTIGGTPATNLQFVANVPVVGGPTVTTYNIAALTAAHAFGLVNVVVTNKDGQVATKTGAYSYQAPAPTVSGATPTSGINSGATAITITGTNFLSGATVKVGGVSATNVVFVGTTSLTAMTPAHAAGLVDVAVTNPDSQVATKTGAYTYVIPAPTISAVSPTLGPITGGTTITITGTNFAATTGVTVGGTAATAVTTVSSTLITAVTPAHSGGLVNISVSNTTGTATKTGAFTYRNPAPTISAITPTKGTTSGGTQATITGANFQLGAWVIVGGVDATNQTFVNSSTITVRMPAHVAGLVSIVINNPDTQTGTLTSAYTYLRLGDANNDGRVNAIDLSILISHDGQNYPAADFNGDGTVGSADMAILLGRWTW